MLALFLTFALAKPAPDSVPPVAPTLYGAPILSAGIRGTVRTTQPESAGLEVRLDSVVFARARLSIGPSITPNQHDTLQDIFGFGGDRPWWGYKSSLEAAWAPIPNVRVGGALSDSLGMTRGREQRLGISATTRGQTTVGPRVAVGLFNSDTSLHVAGGYDFPIAAKRGQINDMTPDAPPPVRATELGNRHYFVELEGRVRYESWVGSAEVNFGRTRRSRALEDWLGPDAQDSNWSGWQPSISLGVSRLF